MTFLGFLPEPTAAAPKPAAAVTKPAAEPAGFRALNPELPEGDIGEVVRPLAEHAGEKGVHEGHRLWLLSQNGRKHVLCWTCIVTLKPAEAREAWPCGRGGRRG